MPVPRRCCPPLWATKVYETRPVCVPSLWFLRGEGGRLFVIAPVSFTAQRPPRAQGLGHDTGTGRVVVFSWGLCGLPEVLFEANRLTRTLSDRSVPCEPLRWPCLLSGAKGQLPCGRCARKKNALDTTRRLAFRLDHSVLRKKKKKQMSSAFWNRFFLALSFR